MKTIIGLGLSMMITAGLMGCTSTEGNANLRNANSNTGYMMSNQNANMASPMPMSTPSTMMNSNMGSNMKPGMNSNMKSNPNSTMNSNMSKMKTNGNKNP